MVQDGVVVCSPARAAAVAHMLRRHVLQTHSLRLSNADRDEKTDRLYQMMTSDRVADRWDQIAQATSDLMDIERNDAAWQEKTRTKRTVLIHAVEAAHDEFVGEIDRIVGGNDLEPSP